MHLKGCYDWFRKPPTEYEKWEKQHAKKKRRREEEESKRQKREEVWMKECREEMEKRRQFIRDQGLKFFLKLFLTILKYQRRKVWNKNVLSFYYLFIINIIFREFLSHITTDNFLIFCSSKTYLFRGKEVNIFLNISRIFVKKYF